MASKISFKQMQEDITDYIGGQVFLKSDKVTDYEVSINVSTSDIKEHNGNTLPKLQKENVKLIQIIDDDDILVGIAFVKSYNNVTDEYEVIAVEYGKGNFAIYKSKIDLDLVVDNEVTLTLTDLDTTGITTKDLAINQIVYDKNKTVGFISSIDLTNNNFKVKTMTTDTIATGVKIYKYTNTLDNTIDNQVTINFSDLDVGTTPITDLQEEQLVYDKEGTVSKIISIDTTANTLDIKAITTDTKAIQDRIEVAELDKTINNTTTIPYADIITTITDVSELVVNQLVYDKDGTVAKIDDVHITPTGTTIDITTITTSGKSFDLEYYKYTKKLNISIDTTQIILFADLSVASGVTINDLKVNQIIFDDDGTVSKIENINTVDNEVTVRIITKDEMLMKEYKITETINLVVDSQQLVNIPAGTTANEIKIDQLVYDDNGTVAKVVSVDTTTNKMMIQTITGLGMPIAPDTKEFKIENGGSGYQVGDIVESLKSGVFVEVTSIDTTTGAILGITDTTQTTSAAHGTQAKISEEQVIYGGYGRNWAQLSDAAVQVAIVVAEKFEYDEGYSFEIVNAGSGYVVGNVIATDNPNVFVSITSVGVSGEILDVQYTRDDNVNASGTGANIAAVVDKNVFVILDKYWNEQGIAIFSLTNDDGAWVEFLRTDDSLIKYSAGPNNKTYKFVYNPVNGTITQSYTECSSGGSAEGITFEDNKNYLENDLIMHNNKLYKCTQDYTSTNDFDTDLVNGYWEQYLVVEIGGEIV